MQMSWKQSERQPNLSLKLRRMRLPRIHRQRLLRHRWHHSWYLLPLLSCKQPSWQKLKMHLLLPRKQW